MAPGAGVQGVVPISEMRGDDEEDSRLLADHLRVARQYLRRFNWCRGIRAEYFGLGVGGIVAVFLFQIEPAPGVDEWLWVFAGDLPSAYCVCDDAKSPNDALRSYCRLMDGWVHAVRSGAGARDVFPVHAEATMRNAESLEERIGFLRRELLGGGRALMNPYAGGPNARPRHPRATHPGPGISRKITSPSRAHRERRCEIRRGRAAHCAMSSFAVSFPSVPPSALWRM